MYIYNEGKNEQASKGTQIEEAQRKRQIWALTGPVSDFATTYYRNGDLVPFRGQEQGARDDIRAW
jgi:hypothetical protein